MKLNITSRVLDVLGFSEYWDENCTSGGRTLTFSNGTQFRITQINETDDENEGYGAEKKYVAEHFYFIGWFALPKTSAEYYELFFLHEMYECIKKEYPSCLEEFVDKCKKLGMYDYLKEWIL